MDLTSTPLYSSFVALGIDIASLVGTKADDMDLDDVSAPDSPLEAGEPSPELSSMEKQTATLRTYLNHLPYECESVDEMQQQLEHIVGMITICATSKSWLILTTWDGVLQWSVLICCHEEIGLILSQLAPYALPYAETYTSQTSPPILRTLSRAWPRAPCHAKLGRHALTSAF